MTPSIIYGTAWKKERTATLVIQAVLAGFRAIDTACQLKHYREDLVGDALETLEKDHGIKREDIFLQTKYTPISGQDRSQPLPYDPSSEITRQVHDSCSKSLKNLRTSYLDSYLLHSPLSTMERTLEAWRALCELQDSGVVKSIGMSNVYDVRILDALEELGGRRAGVVQNRWYEGNGFDREVVAYCKQKGISYQSFWTLTGTPSLLHHPGVTALAKRKSSPRAASPMKVTPAMIVYRMVQQWGITPLAGSTDEEHMKDGVAVEKIPLTDDDIPRAVRILIMGS